MPYLMPKIGLAERMLQENDSLSSKEYSVEQAIQKGASGDLVTMLEDLPREAFTG